MSTGVSQNNSTFSGILGSRSEFRVKMKMEVSVEILTTFQTLQLYLVEALHLC